MHCDGKWVFMEHYLPRVLGDYAEHATACRDIAEGVGLDCMPTYLPAGFYKLFLLPSTPRSLRRDRPGERERVLQAMRAWRQELRDDGLRELAHARAREANKRHKLLHERYAICYMLYAICYMLYTICYMLYYMLCAICYMLYSMLYAT